MIIESVVTTVDAEGEPNFAAMGVVWGDEAITIRPFVNTRTYRNLSRSREAVVNVTDDVLAFTKSALTHERLGGIPARRVRGVILGDACRWREVVVAEIVLADPAGPGPRRAEVRTRVVAGGEGRAFAGLCRAKHAVVEASILASRHRLRPLDEILRELDRLEALVAKTGGAGEHAAMALIRGYLAAKAG